MTTVSRPIACILLAGAAACSGALEPRSDEVSDQTLRFARSKPVCHSTIVVTDESELRAALGSAPPGSSIGVQGTIVTTSDLVIDRPDLTLTCAAPGATIKAGGSQIGEQVWDMITVVASNVTFRSIRVDGMMAGNFVLTAYGDQTINRVIDGFVVEGSTVLCTNQTACINVRGLTRDARIVGNEITADVGYAGILVTASPPVLAERPIIERNFVRELGLNPGAFTGIRVSAATGAVVRRNTVIGPWQSAIGLGSVVQSTIAGNSLLDPLGWGISQGVGGGPGTNGTLIAENFLRGGFSAIGLSFGCGNQLRGNRFSNALVKYVLNVATGANLVVTTNPAGVSDQGARDCDGDGINDPNIVRIGR